MKITYTNQKTEKLCVDHKLQQKRLPQSVAKKLRLRHKQLELVANVAELFGGIGRWEPKNADLKGVVSTRLTGNYRMLIRGTDQAGRENDWDNCTEVEIVEVSEDYHGR